MSEVFKEYLIKQKKSPKDVMAQTGLVAGALILSVVLFTITLQPYASLFVFVFLAIKASMLKKWR